MPLSLDELQRYSQQIKVEAVGIKGQLRLKQARVLCIGAGGLASSLLLYLAGAGVGTIGIVDDDVLELSNLARQVLYEHSGLGQKKAELARQRLSSLNPVIQVEAYTERLTAENVDRLFAQYEVIADCCDNFESRFLIAERAYLLDKSHVFAAVAGFQGQCAVFLGKEGPCLRCLFPSVTRASVVATCEEGGVVGMLPGMLGTLQAMEILKLILNINSPLRENVMLVDLQKLRFQKIRLRKNPECSFCQHHIPSTPRRWWRGG